MAEFLEFSSVGLFCLFWAQVSIPFPPLNRILWVNSLRPDTRHWQHWHSCRGILCHGTLHCPSAASVFVQGFQAEPRAVLSRGLQPPGSLGAGSLGKAALLPRRGLECSLPILPWTHMSPAAPAPSLHPPQRSETSRSSPWCERRELGSRLGRAGRLGRFSVRNSLGCLQNTNQREQRAALSKGIFTAASQLRAELTHICLY